LKHSGKYEFKEKKAAIILFFSLCLLFKIVSTRAAGEESQSSLVVMNSDNKDWEVHFLNTGQGDCILIKGPCNILIDTSDSFRAKQIIKYLINQKVTILDKVIITHYHEDHYGGLLYIAKKIKLQQVLLAPEDMTKNKKYLEKCLANKKISYRELIDNEQFEYLGMELKVLIPKVKKRYFATESNINNLSAVLKGNIGGVKYLFMADCEREGEDYFLNNNLLEKCNVLKVGHHGLNTSTSDRLLNNIRPEIAVITSDGQESPSNKVLKRLGKRGITTFPTHIYKDVILK